MYVHLGKINGKLHEGLVVMLSLDDERVYVLQAETKRQHTFRRID